MKNKNRKESPRNGHPTAQGNVTEDTLKFDVVKDPKKKKN